MVQEVLKTGQGAAALGIGKKRFGTQLMAVTFIP
jgi:hypothetical protein